ncbi:MAG: hypothetical protein AAF849_16605 [Bacteroidota bacterium]
MRKIFLLCSTVFVCGITAFSQPANDDCENATFLEETMNFCSPQAAFTNAGATTSGFDGASCFSGAGEDTWFFFIALATDVTIIIRGDTRVAPGGSLRNPEAALYEGSCTSTLQQLECQTDNENNHIIELYQGGLIPGQTYLLRVQGRNGRTGSFQVCINNFNPPVDPTSDCPQASILCDDSGFSVQTVTGAGSNTRELDDALCFSNGVTVNNETNSTWYTWICDESGTLEFTLTPLNETDDLDFVLYELPNGIGNCRDKRVLRCMASGDFAYPSRCMGPTGLRDGEEDENEPAGCNNGRQNNFLQPLMMESGKSYALGINNFTSTGNGFNLEFGGTGTFLGPKTNVTLDASIAIGEDDNVVCLNENIAFTDSSSFAAGQITGWTWTFGVSANPINRSGEGPHEVSYNTPGEKIIALTVETDLGCTVTEIARIEVVEPPSVDFDLQLPDCGGGTNGGIELTASGGSVPYQFEWDGSGIFTMDRERQNLGEGTYSVIVKDAQNCTSAPFEVFLPEDSIQLNESIAPVIEPSCTGFSDGILVVSPIKGSAPYEYDFGTGFVSDSTLENLSAGIYTVSVRDASGCNSTFDIMMGEPDSLQLELLATNISCKGLIDGTIESIVNGGVGDYAYLWNTASTEASLSELRAGTYRLIVQDANGCEIEEVADIIEPGGLRFLIDEIIDATCPDTPSGRIKLATVGGTPPFEFSVVGGNFQADSTINNLLAGDYQIVVRDSRGCEGDTLSASVGEPPAFLVDAGADRRINLGFDTDLEAIVLPLDKQVEFFWTSEDSLTLSCVNCPNPTAFPFNSTQYTITVIDENGCTAIDQVIVRVEKERPIYIPTAFAPESGDTANSRFTLFGGRASVGIRTLKIFSRWGDLLFEADNIPIGDSAFGWDGTFNDELVNSGVYAFYAEIEFIDQEVVVFEGDVTLLR